MKVFAISDLHFSFSVDKPMDVFGGEWSGYEEKIMCNWKEKIADDDVVLVAGDISWGMNFDEARADLLALSKLAGKKVIIKGNHDYWWKGISSVREFLPEGIFALQNDSQRFENVLVCGTRGWLIAENGKKLSKEDQKISDRELIRLGLTLEHMTKERREGDFVICMMHYPPFNNSRGSSEFTKLISKFNIDCVVYGHVHGKRDNRGSKTIIDGVTYLLTSCDQIANDPVLVYESK